MRYTLWVILVLCFVSCDRYQAQENNKRGMDYINRNLYEKALEEFNNAISLAPDFLPAYYNRAIVQANLKQPGKRWKI